MASSEPHLLVFMLLYNPSELHVRLCNHQDTVEIRWITSKARSQKWLQLCLAGSWITVSGETSCHARKTLKQPFGEASCVENRSILSIAITSSSITWVSHLGSKSSSPSQAFRWCSPCWYRNCNLMSNPKPEAPSSVTPEWPTQTAR